MLISLVVPVLNAARGLEQTLRSIRAAGSESCEVIVQDGGSADGVEKVIARFDGLVTHFSSGPDEGQYDAIDQGFRKASGDVLGWINAGDIFLPGALVTVARIFSEHPEVSWLTGRACLADEGSLAIIPPFGVAVSNFEIRNGLCRPGAAGFLQQEGMFWSRGLWERSGGLNRDLKLAADFELWTRMADVAPLHRINVPLAAFSHHHDNRSLVLRDRYLGEVRGAVRALPSQKRWAGKMMQPFTLGLKALGRVPGLRLVLALLLRSLPGLRIEEFGWERAEAGELRLRKRVRTAWLG